LRSTSGAGACDAARCRSTSRPTSWPGRSDPQRLSDALAVLSTHERFVLLLRFDAGFTLREIAQLVGIGEDAARKRVSRARAAFRSAYRAPATSQAPRVLLLVRDDESEPYVRWLMEAGAQIDVRRSAPSEREVLLADAFVVTGSTTDIDPALYGDQPTEHLAGTPDLRRDRRDIAALRTALRAAVPVLGVCGGHQLLNVASGGTLHQDLATASVTPVDHEAHRHRVETRAGTRLRRAIGPSSDVGSAHHQGIRHLGNRLRTVGTAPDGVIEAIERTDRRLAIGVQWRPQDDPGGRSSRRLAEMLIEEALGA
jgi:gamma-glutamyl-gamma-aminobutyrate hydrolase PuuD